MIFLCAPSHQLTRSQKSIQGVISEETLYETCSVYTLKNSTRNRFSKNRFTLYKNVYMFCKGGWKFLKESCLLKHISVSPEGSAAFMMSKCMVLNKFFIYFMNSHSKNFLFFMKIVLNKHTIS